jgi:exosome complex component RRP45
MPREADPSTNEHAFVLAALRENVRLDGRNLDQFRPVSLQFPESSDEYGVADVRIGKTRVLCKISCEVVAPYVDRTFDGIFTISTELSPLASPAFEVARYEATHTVEVVIEGLIG